MQTTIALLSLAAAAYAAPQAALAPTASAPAGCSSSYSGTFEIQAVNISSVAKRSVEKRATACGGDGTLVINLANGKLTDAKSRVGEIVANYQFQFDPEPQTGAIYTSGFSACNNGSLALGGSAVFYECLSGGFYNLYDRSWAAQCQPILLNIIPCGSGATGAVGQSADGQPTGTAIGQKTDGQPTGTAVVTGAVSQITDGQVQAGTPVPIAQITDGQIQVVTAVPISQIADGQIQAPTKATGVVSQISDGQVQATTAASGVVSQIGDGQIQAPTKATGVISQISDGQIQATGAFNASKPSSTAPIQASSGSSLHIGSQLAAIVLGAVAVALL